MHAFKGAWVGQTFALATPNDSGGKKARIRRSKEERKSMVETFIKKYQKSNNGNFPSLNLTHKEVGGSFYTVREIVRDIIQENRVLGPSKLPLEEHNFDNLSQHYPLGSISIEPEPCETQITSHITLDENQGSGEGLVESYDVLLHQAKHQILDIEQQDCGTIDEVEDYKQFVESCDSGTTSSPLEGTCEGQLLNFSGQLPTSEAQNLDSGLIGEGTEATDLGEESYVPELGGPVHEETTKEHVDGSSEDPPPFAGQIPVNGHRSSNQHVIVNGTTQGAEENDIGNVDAEISVRKQLESSNTDRTLVKPDIQVEKFPLRPVAKNIDGLGGHMEVHSTTLDMNGNGQFRLPLSKGVSTLVNPEISVHTASQPVNEAEAVDTSLESSKSSSTKEPAVLAADNVAELGTKMSSSVEIKSLNSPTAFSASVNNVADKKSTSTASPGVKYKLNIEHKSGSQEGIESRFERIELEKERKASEKPTSSEINPLMAIFKAFMDAIVKFLNE